MKTKLVTLVTDLGFLVPSLVAASQVAMQGIGELADIVIYTIDIPGDVLSQIRPSFAQKGIRIETLPESVFKVPAGVDFHLNHVPPATLARLALSDVIDTQYKDIVYLDGDVQVVGDISSLVRYEVPQGKILAGRGSAWLDDQDDPKNMTPEGYLESLGGVSPESYFNAGVLAFKASTWAEMAPKASRFFQENSKACIRHDQSALNAVFRGNVVELAPKFNFHSIYADLYVWRKYKPAIIHFTGPDKPWRYLGAPWDGRYRPAYLEMQQAFPILASLLNVSAIPGKRVPSLVLEAHRIITEKRRRSTFFNYVKQTPFPF